MLLYVCEKCHKWQDVSFGVFLTNTWNNAMKSTPEAKIADPTVYPCPNGCGMMTQVKPEEKISIFKEPSGFVVFPPDYTFAECVKHLKESRAESAQHDQLLEDVYALLKEYAETFPWETELKDRADLLLERIGEAFSQEPEKESTDLFDVVSKFTHKYPNACNVTAQSDEDKIMATYRTNIHTWELAVLRPQGMGVPIGETMFKKDLQAMAKKHNIDLSKGWRIVNSQYKY